MQVDILYRADRTVVDITVEDPSDNFVRLRDFVDTRNCLKLEAFSVDKIVKVSETLGKPCKYVGEPGLVLDRVLFLTRNIVSRDSLRK